MTGSRLQLRDFAVLEIATISSRLFSLPDNSTTKTTGIFTLLPPSIREFTVCSLPIEYRCYVSFQSRLSSFLMSGKVN